MIFQESTLLLVILSLVVELGIKYLSHEYTSIKKQTNEPKIHNYI